MEKILRFGEKIIPSPLYKMGQPFYHKTLSILSALRYGFPSKHIKIIGVTGTKGKSTTTEIINTILEEAGYTTALTNTIRFKIGNTSTKNLYKMSMPGRFFVQNFIRKAVDEKCDFLILEMTSQGALQHRHLFIDLDAFVFTNLSPEHIEAHGSYEKYVQAKVDIVMNMEKSKKPNKTIIVNKDDKESEKFLSPHIERKVTYSLQDASPYEIKSEGIDFTLDGIKVSSPLSGLFNLYNILAGVTCAKNFGIQKEIIARALEKFSEVKGRVEKVEAGQDFKVIVDYAHTIDSLEKLYNVFPKSRKICVLGGTGGGRDVWKRKEMGKIVEKYCDEIILTDEDPYDENPIKIVEDIREGIATKGSTIIMDRRMAIREAIQRAKKDDVILITGKGTDPYIMGPKGSMIPWSDAGIAKEELEKSLSNK